jgi:hypothetical protein
VPRDSASRLRGLQGGAGSQQDAPAPVPENEQIQWNALIREVIGMLWSTRQTTLAEVRARHQAVRHGFAVIFWITMMFALTIAAIVSLIEGHPIWYMLFRAIHGS